MDVDVDLDFYITPYPQKSPEGIKSIWTSFWDGGGIYRGILKVWEPSPQLYSSSQKVGTWPSSNPTPKQTEQPA